MSDDVPNHIKVHERLNHALSTLAHLAPVNVPLLKGNLLQTIDKVRLLHFPSNAGSLSIKTPLVICYALVNRPTILDIEPDRSLIKSLCDLGYDIYLIDWGYPDICDQHLSLDDYIDDYLDSVVDTVCKHTNKEQVDLLGICQGGVFSLAYASLYPTRIRKLVTLVTPVDTEVADFTLSDMIRETDVSLLVKAYGNLPGTLLNQVYAALKPLQLGVMKEFALANNLSNDKQATTYILMEHWINDSPDLAGQAAIEFAELFFQANGLIKGHMLIAGRQVELRQITAPILNIFGLKDHLVPPASSQALRGFINKKTRYTELALNAGHIGAFISEQSRTKLLKAIASHLG